MNIVLDIVIALILVVFAVRGAKRGFVLTLAGLVTYIIALLGAMLVTHLFAQTVATKFIAPMVGDKIVPAISEAGDALGLEDVVAFGVRLGDLPAFGEIDMNVEHAVGAATQSIVDALSLSIARCIVSVISFVVILIILKIVAHAIDLVFRLPVLGTLNNLLGLIAGIVTGVVLVLLLVAVLSMFTGLIPQEMADRTILFRFFRDLSPLTFIPQQGGVAA